MLRVVVLGAGYAGLQAAKGAARSGAAQVTLVDRSDHHQLVTEMHRVAGGEEDPRAVTFPIARLVGPRVHFRQATVAGIRPQERVVHTSAGELTYDVLVLALGSEAEFFGVPGAREHALTLQYLDSALRIRNRLHAELRQGRTVAVVVVGGGLTGVELASALADHLRAKARQPWRITLLQAAPTVLPEEAEELAAYAERALVAEGVEVRAATPVRAVEQGRVVLADGGALEASLIVWAAGVRANALPGEAGFPVDRRGRVKVDEALRVEGSQDVFACGDVAVAKNPATGLPLPPTAQLALQEGRLVGGNVRRLLAGEELAPFTPRILGLAAELGRRRGIASFGRWHVTGPWAVTVKRLALLRYLYEVGGWTRAWREPFLAWWSDHPQHVRELLDDQGASLPG